MANLSVCVEAFWGNDPIEKKIERSAVLGEIDPRNGSWSQESGVRIQNPEYKEVLAVVI